MGNNHFRAADIDLLISVIRMVN